MIHIMARPVQKFRPEGIPHDFRYLWLSHSVSVRMSTNQIRLQLQNQTQVFTEAQFCISSDANLPGVIRSHCGTGTVSKACIDLRFRPFGDV
jgi:hypothetical protein